MCTCCVPHSITCARVVFLAVSYVHVLCSSHIICARVVFLTVSRVHVLCSSQYRICTCRVTRSIKCARVVFLSVACARVVFLAVSRVHVSCFSQYHVYTCCVPHSITYARVCVPRSTTCARVVFLTVSHVHVLRLNTNLFLEIKTRSSYMYQLPSSYCDGQYEECNMENIYSCSY